MLYVRINNKLYPATIEGKLVDRDWDNRSSKSILLKIDYETAVSLFVDGLTWSIVEQIEEPVYSRDDDGNLILGDDGNPVSVSTDIKETEWDNSEFTIAGDIIDHRDGTITAKMGKLTELEVAYEIILGGLN